MADPIITIPLANAIRFVLTNPATLVNSADPDFILTEDQHHYGLESRRFYQPYQTNETVPVHYQSDSDGVHELKVLRLSDDTVVGTLNPAVVGNLSDRDIYEVTIDWSLYAAGDYYLIMSGTDSVNSTWTARSEPIALRASHPYSLVLIYRNIDNAFTVAWGELEMRLRLPKSCYLREANNTEELEIFDDDSYNSDVLYGTMKRLLKLKCYDLPPWLHEKIKLAFIHDYKEINGIRLSNDQGGYTYEYEEDYPFADGEITVSRWGESQINRHDNSTPFVGLRELEDNIGYRKLE